MTGVQTLGETGTRGFGSISRLILYGAGADSAGYRMKQRSIYKEAFSRAPGLKVGGIGYDDMWCF